MKEAHDHHRVSPEGQKIGQMYGALADQECASLVLQGEDDERCKSCAFRPGTVPNGCIQTQLDAVKAVCEDVPFMCHQKLDGKGQPSTICHGWFSVRRIVDRFETATGKKLVAPYDFSPPDVPKRG